MRPSLRWLPLSGLAAAAASLALAAPAPASERAPFQRVVGSTVMTALSVTPHPAFLARIRAGEVGGVILIGHRWQTTAEIAQVTRQLQATACESGEPILIAVDQEGGLVRRLPWAAPAESASGLGDGSVAHTQIEAHAAAAALRRAGIDIDLAPVADTRLVPNAFLRSRLFSDDPTVVGHFVTAFVRGLQAGKVAATAKHFPGLGAATQNTDDHRVSVRETRLEPFESAIAAGTKLVMVSNASYPLLDGSGRPAVFSHTIVTGLLRQKLGFDGVVVSDALDAPTPAATPHATARAIAAGVDLLLYTNAAAADRGYASLLADAAGNATLRAQVTTASDRIAGLKEWLGKRCSG